MFKKKPNIKTLSPLRSSDRRKIADNIISNYRLELPARDVDDVEAKAAATAAQTGLRNSILPENSLSAKFTTTLGSDLKQVTGTVYVGSHDTGEQRVLWFSVNDVIYPSVYSLWRNPSILPLLHTPSAVVEKIQGGSDLMTPGLAGPPFPNRAIKGATVAVASVETPTVPMVVGTCEIDVSALETTRGVKGHAVKPLHWAGDTIWDWSTSGRPGQKSPESIKGWTSLINDVADQAEALAIDNDDDDDDDGEDGGVNLATSEKPNNSSESTNGHHNLVDKNQVVETIDENEVIELSTQQIDDAFHQAFLYGVHHQKETSPSKPKFGLVFPLNQSFVMSNLVLPFLPTFTPKEAEQLVIKKSSYKNARKFIKSLEKKKLVLVKGRGSNEVDVLDVDFDDHAFKDFVPYRLPHKSTKDEKASNKNNMDQADDSIGQRLKRIELFRPKDKVASIFQIAQTSSKTYLTTNEIKRYVLDYVESERLIDQSNKRLVRLDPLLLNSFFNTGKQADADVLVRGSISRDGLVERVIGQCSAFHVITRNDESVDDAKLKPKAGSLPGLEVLMETRSGNKIVTKISGVEAFHINPQSLADELRKSCACSTSIESSKSGKGLEVMVQGPQKDNVIAALEKRGVNNNWINIIDKSKSKKR